MSTQETVDAIKADLDRFTIPDTDENFDLWVQKAVDDGFMPKALLQNHLERHHAKKPSDLAPMPMAALWENICNSMMVQS